MNERLLKFSNELRNYLQLASKARPFVCEGNPLECKIFIVGYNAATEMKSDFWEYWDDEYGFNKKKWMEAYEKERFTSGKRKTSPTRERIELITKSANSCLETNIYAIPTPKARDLIQENKSTALFEFLLQEIKPKVIFVHGVKAIQYMNKMSSVNLIMHEEKEIKLFGNNTILIAGPHLSRGWSYEKATELGIILKNLY